MSTLLAPRITMLVAAGVVGLAGCAGESTGPVAAERSLRTPGGPSFAIGDVPASSAPEVGKLKLCKEGNVEGVFTIVRAPLGTSAGTALTDATLQPGTCVVAAEDLSGSGSGSDLTVTETSAGLVSISASRADAIGPSPTPVTFANGGTVFVNQFHGYTITFTNRVDTPPPPTAVCDFITFGRLVTSVNNKKVVISGNAGGNKPGGGIMGEFHIEANGVDNHVADIDTYGPITSGPLFGLTNSRIVTGTAKNGVAVELRLYDGGEPGKGTDVVYVKLNGVVTLNAAGQLIDQGNMQYHANCRGPKK